MRENSQNFRGNPVFNGQTLTPALSQRRGSKCAFTLAEVLITLVIIGVIAAITIPSLINKTNNQEYVSRLKKAYSTMSQVTNMIIAEQGPVTAWDISTDSTDDIYHLYKKYLNNAKECSAEEGCFSQGAYKTLPGVLNGNLDTNSSMRKLVLTDGTQVAFSKWLLSKNCDQTDRGSKNVCALIYVDINGAKKPNIQGKDLFEFVLKENGLQPAGCDETGWCNGNVHSDGWGCACKVLREGAINY